jgi:hypothetical protein
MLMIKKKVSDAGRKNESRIWSPLKISTERRLAVETAYPQDRVRVTPINPIIIKAIWTAKTVAIISDPGNVPKITTATKVMDAIVEMRAPNIPNLLADPLEGDLDPADTSSCDMEPLDCNLLSHIRKEGRVILQSTVSKSIKTYDVLSGKRRQRS